MDLYDIIAGNDDFDRWDYVNDFEPIDEADEPDTEEVSLDEYLATVEV